MLDERSAAFFGLGCAKRQHRPVALICTSGTAGANFYPAIIEARESGVALLVFTADRPPELRDCASGQTIDQQKLFGDFPNRYSELATPAVERLDYLRQTMVQAWARSRFPPGPVHLNCPFRDPLPPLPDPEIRRLQDSFDESHFFSMVRMEVRSRSSYSDIDLPLDLWRGCDRGLIIAGPAQPPDPAAYCQAVGKIAQALGWPVLAEGLSPLRNYRDFNPLLVSTYDIILRQPERADALKPACVIQLGPLPTSKVLRQWLQQTQPQTWVITDRTGVNLDPLHGLTQAVILLLEQLSKQLSISPKPTVSLYCQQWLKGESIARQRLNQKLENLDSLFEGKVAWLLSKHLPAETPLFIANSMPVRDVETFWQPNQLKFQPAFNRGANGIDGTLSTAMGWAHQNRSSVLLTGDLALLHDTNGFLNVRQLKGHLTIVLINNQGGGIFEMLPISQFEPEFEPYFAMPQSIDFEQLCRVYGIPYYLIEQWSDLIGALNPLPQSGVRVIEIRTGRKADASWRQTELVDVIS